MLFDALPQTDVALMGICSMSLRQRSGTVVRYASPGREDHMLHYAVSGEREYTLPAGETLRISPGDVLLLPMGASYASWAGPREDAWGYNVRFLLRDEKGNALTLEDGIHLLYHDDAGQLCPLFRELAALSTRSGAKLEAKACLARLVERLVSLRTAARGDFLARAAAYMGARLDAPLTVRALADFCHMSERTFCRKFKEATGQAPIAYHRRLRILKAQEFLENGAFTLEAIAEALGFSDAAHLSRCYYREMGRHVRDERRGR